MSNFIKPIFMSSERVFDGGLGNYSEDDPANAETVYGTQKMEIEQYLAQSGGDYAVLRLAKVYGIDVALQSVDGQKVVVYRSPQD